MTAYPIMKFSPHFLPNRIKSSLLLECVKKTVNSSMLRRGQGELVGFELLPLQALNINRRPLDARGLDRSGHLLLWTSHDEKSRWEPGGQKGCESPTHTSESQPFD
jgi:hypothetical protein